MLRIKCVFIGDKGSGKTSCIAQLEYVLNLFPPYAPHVYGPSTGTVEVDGKPVALSVMDTDANDIAHTRLTMDGADVFLICFDISDYISFRNASEKWKNEVHEYNVEKGQNVPFLLVGCKSDLREGGHQDTACIALREKEAELLVHRFCKRLNNKDLIRECFKFYFNEKWIISKIQGQQTAAEIGASLYAEAADIGGLKQLFEDAIRIAIDNQLKSDRNDNNRERNQCIVL